MMPCLFPPAALSKAVYQMVIINRCYFLVRSEKFLPLTNDTSVAKLIMILIWHYGTLKGIQYGIQEGSTTITFITTMACKVLLRSNFIICNFRFCKPEACYSMFWCPNYAWHLCCRIRVCWYQEWNSTRTNALRYWSCMTFAQAIEYSHNVKYPQKWQQI
jgi:hypothetical protein